ncbi:MAG: ATP-binding protein [Syntrophales bacterium]|nr:ATP-binding protein [Syntrophales bacterium]MCU0553898.1 ATP-binding protein [Syntrophales bacterium]
MNQIPSASQILLRPITLIISCTIFVILILVMGLMDLNRLDRSLVNFMEVRGLDVAEKIERESLVSYTSIMQMLRGEAAGETLIPLTDETFLTQESLIKALLGVIRAIDSRWASSIITPEEAKGVMDKEGLWLLAVLDEGGRVLFQSRPLPRQVLARAKPVIQKNKDLVIDLFGGPERVARSGVVALRRSGGGGTIIVALDDDALRWWGMRIAMQKAVDEAGQTPGVVFVTVLDGWGAVLGARGEQPASQEMTTQEKELLSGAVAVTARGVKLGEKELLMVMAPLSLEGRPAGVVRVGFERDRMDQILERNRHFLFLSMGFIVLAGLFSLWFVFQNQKRHLARIEEMRKRLEQSERLSSLGQLAAGVAHEIRNPLNAISMASQRLQREYMPCEQDKGADFGRLTGVIRDEIRRLNVIIEDFLTFSRSRRLELREFSLTEVIQKLARLMGEEARVRGIALTVRPEQDSLMVPMDVDKLQQALINIVKNAMESIDGTGSIGIAMEKQPGDRAVVRITDTGSGLAPGEVEKIFDPDYTTKEKGLGLGLPIAYEIIRGHGGTIRVQSSPGQGTTFEIELPTKPASSGTAAR